jgi:predicted phosphodiesterase
VYLVDVTRHVAHTSGVFTLYTIGDLHSERREFNEARFKKYRAAILADKDRAVVVCAGDFTEGRTPGMKHWDPMTIRPEFLTNLESFLKHSLAYNERLLKPLADAGIPVVVVSGNHDDYLEYTGYAAMLADRIGAQYLGGGGFVRVRSGEARRVPRGATGAMGGQYTTLVHATHGSGGGGRPGGKINKMQQSVEAIGADVYVAGHVHDGAIRVVHRTTASRTGDLRMVKEPVALYRAPSFVERSVPGVTGYAVKKEMGLVDEGLQYLEINPRTRTMQRHELPISCAIPGAA